MDQHVGIIGAPTSAGAFAPGQERAPAVLRNAGLVEQFVRAGADVVDYGDIPGWRWQPDRENPLVQNLSRVIDAAAAVAVRVGEVRAAGRSVLVLGGDCTVGLGTIAGHSADLERVGLIYFDMHADLNVPNSVPSGTLDWMGVAHMLGHPKAVDSLSHLGSRCPLLNPAQILLFSHRRDQATAWELSEIARHPLNTISLEEVAKNPEQAAGNAVEMMAGYNRVLVHFDVDVIDFTDAPLSENPGRNIGLKADCAFRALRVLLASASVCGLTVTELNPDHGEPGGLTIRNFVRDLVTAICGPVKL